MSTLSGKPANPIDLSAYALQKAGERAERNSADNDRSPYAPKEAPWRRADAQPPTPGRAAEGLRERSGRDAPKVEEPVIDRDDAPEAGWPRANAQRGRSAHAAFDGEDVPAHPADLDELRSSEAESGDWYEEPPLAPRDAAAGDSDLERLESSLRWLQRQEAVTRLPPAPGLPAGDGRRRHGTDKFVGDFRSPLSLEPERMAPPPLSSGRGNLRWAFYVLIAAAVAAPVAYYFSADSGGSRTEMVARPQLASSDASQPSVSAVRQELAPTVARDEEPETMREAPPQSRAAKTAKLPARLPAEGDNVAMLQPPASSPSPSQFPAVSPPQPAVASPQPSPFPNPQAPAPSAPQRTVDPAQIELLTKQGEQFVAAGDLVTARMVFQRAAEAGDAYAAMAMGATFDPGVLAKLGVVGMGADVEKARSWYQKAESMGSAEATKRLRVLAHR
jgi:hypothetical protein